jgi:hypothetical protein
MTSTGASSNDSQQDPYDLWSYLAEQVGGNFTTFGEDNTEFTELCENCTKLDLVSRLLIEYREICLGPLTHYLRLTCPLCALVWDSVRLCSGTGNVLIQHGKKPVLHVFRCYNSLLLYIVQKPSGFSGLDYADLAPDVSACFEKESFLISHWDFCYQKLPNHIVKSETRKTIRNRLDIVRLRWLLHRCTDHDLCRHWHLKEELFSPSFRLIDVYEARLVEKTSPCDYFALSYV